jgi:hypothetical protein
MHINFFNFSFIVCQTYTRLRSHNYHGQKDLEKVHQFRCPLSGSQHSGQVEEVAGA